jgi:hypothetical protein
MSMSSIHSRLSVLRSEECQPSVSDISLGT